MQRYFVKREQVNLPYITIVGDDVHHIVNVMRMKVNDKIYISDQVDSYLVEIDNISNTEVVTKIVEKLNESKELPINVTIAHGIVRREKTEEVVDYLTELGASFYQPVIMERSIIKVNNDKADKKNIRLNKIAKEAAEQSHRVKMLKVLPTIDWNQFLMESKKYDLCLYAYEASSKNDSLKKILKKYQNIKSILIIVGPEGGISDKEVKSLEANNFLPISLGPRILRTQVAPLYILSAISYELEV